MPVADCAPPSTAISQLDKTSFQVLRKKGTEPAGTGEYDKFFPKEGHFVCKGCGNPLYSAQSKFNSGCGWPAFDKCYKGALITETDMTFGMKRVEIMCGACDGHLGHVFENEGFTPTAEEEGLARRIIEAWDEAEAEGRGSFELEGKMIDVPVVLRAQRVVAKCDAIRSRNAKVA